MLNTILHYLTLIFAVACFTVIYFKLLSATVNHITAGKVDGKVSTIYTSFFVRLFLAFLFFYCLLKYYNEIRDIIIMVLVFICVRYFIIRHEKSIFSDADFATNTTKTSNSTGLSHQKSNSKTRSKSQKKSTKGKKSISAGKSVKNRLK